MERTHELTPEAEVAQLKEEISDTQGELQRTVAEIQARLSPTNLKEQAAQTVREATVGRVETMVSQAGERVEQAAETTKQTAASLFDQVRSNPLPYALIGAGVAWLVAGKRPSQSSRSWSGSNRPTSANANEYNFSDETSSYRGTTQYSREMTRYPGGVERNVPYSAGQRPGDAATDVSADTRERLRRVSSQAQRQGRRMMEGNPLALGVAALAAGALVGSIIPATDLENEYLGEARDSVVESTRAMAEETAEKARAVARETAEKLVGGEPQAAS